MTDNKDIAQQQFRELSAELMEFREAVSTPIADYACVDAKKAPLKDIAKEVMNLHASHDKLRRRAEAERAEIIAKTSELVEKARQEVEKAETERDKAETEYNQAKHSIELAKRDLNSRIDGMKKTLDNLNSNTTEILGVCRDAMAGILEFPDAVLEASGPAVYQALKAAYQRAGGDVTQLPMPAPVIPELEEVE